MAKHNEWELGEEDSKYFADYIEKYKSRNTKYALSDDDEKMFDSYLQKNLSKYQSDAQDVYNRTKDTYQYITDTLKGAKDKYVSAETIADLRTKTGEYKADLKRLKMYGYDVNNIDDEITNINTAVHDINAFYSQWADEQSYNDYMNSESYKRLQTLQGMTKDALSASDFKEYSEAGANIENPKRWETHGVEIPFINDLFATSEWDGIHWGGKKPENIVTYSRDEENAHAIELSPSEVGDSKYSKMTDEEVSVYNYYLGKEKAGVIAKGTAQKYLDSINETLNMRVASGWYDGMKDNTPLEMVFGVVAGLDQFKSGMVNLFSSNGTATPYQYTSGMVRENLADADNINILGNSLAQTAYDAITTTSNMLPSIGVSMLANAILPGSGQVIGAGLIGASASGNAYQQMLNLGYSDGQSRAYSLLVGLSEAGLEYALGGVKALGGKLTNNAIGKLASKVNNAIGRIAIEYGGEMLSEGVEESLQEILEPLFKAWIMNEAYEAPDFEQVVYAGLLGALSSVPLNAGGNAIANVQAKVDYKGAQEGLVASGLESADGTVSRNLSLYLQKHKLDEGKNLSGRDLRTLAEANQNAMIDEDKIAIADATEKRLSELGETSDPKALAEIVAKKMANEKLSFEEKKTLKNSKYGQRVLNELNESNIIQGTHTSDWALDINTNQINGSVSGYVNSANNRALSRKFKIDTDRLEQKISEKALASGTVEVNGGKTSEIKRVMSVGNKVAYELSDGSVANENNVKFASEDEALLYEVATHSGYSMDVANAIINGYRASGGTSISKYLLGVDEAYNYGRNNIAINENADSFASELTDSQRQFAYNLGREASAKDYADAQTRVSSAKDESVSRKGRVVMSASTSTMSKIQRSSALAIGKLTSEVTHNNVVVYESVVKNGKRVFSEDVGGHKAGDSAPNGFYDPNTGTIYIDLHAGDNGEGTMLWTYAHELTHFVKQWSPEKFKVLADFLVEEYGKKGEDVDKLVKRQMAKARARGRVISYDTAFEEVIADSMSQMLTDTNLAEKIAKLKAKDEGLVAKIKEFFSKLLKIIKGEYSKYESQTPEALAMKKLADSVERITDLFAEAIVDAGETFEKVGLTFDADTKSVAPSMLSERTWSASEYVRQTELVAESIAAELGVSKEEALKYIKDINSVAKAIADDRIRLDYDSNIDPTATVLKPNSEYKWSVDMSTLCAKRLLFTGTFDAIQRLMPNTVFDSDDIVALRKMMMDRGYQVACGPCYVESTRREIGDVTNQFIERYKLSQKNGKPITRINAEGKEKLLTEKGTKRTFVADKNYTPTMADLNTTDIDKVKVEHPDVYAAYLTFMNARGQQKPKLLETRAEYKGEILDVFKRKENGSLSSATISRNNHGGLRLQSFSDFEIAHLIDMMQIVMDMSRVGLKSQAYTKVPAFAEAFGNTGIKINLSLIAKGDGIDSKGNLIFDDIEGINSKEAFRLRNKFSKNVGTILVGKSDAHIIAAMADPRIDYIIPFHKSQWKESLYEALGLTGYEDYTDYQNEKAIDSDRKIKNFDPSEYWDFSKSGDENAQIYLEKCREDGRLPKFPQFQNYPGYWKLLIDFKMYDNDGVGSPQTEVRPIFDNKVNQKILKGYEGGHREFTAADDVVKDFVAQHKQEQSEQKLSDRATNEYLEKSIKKYGNVEKAAIEHFGLTDNLRVAGYILTDGKMLDFSGAHWLEGESPEYIAKWKKQNDIRQVDHEDIFEAFDIASGKSAGDNRLEFLKRGNIRISPEAPGIDIATEPTAEQYEMIRNFLKENPYNVEGFYVDIEGETKRAEKLTYSGKVNADKVINDIKYYYANGTVRDNSLQQFLYSDRDSEGNSLTKEQIEFFKDSKLRDEDGNLMPIYRGTRHGIAPGDTRLEFYSTNSGIAKGYAGGITDELKINKDTKTKTPIMLRMFDEYRQLIWAKSEWSPITDEETKAALVNRDYQLLSRSTIGRHNEIDYFKMIDKDIEKEAKKLGYTREEYFDVAFADTKGVFKAYANLVNPIIIDAKGRNWDEIRISPSVAKKYGLKAGKQTTDDIIDTITVDLKGNVPWDGIIIKNVVDYTYGSDQTTATDVIPLKNDVVKSAYNTKPTSKPDVRYSDRDSYLLGGKHYEMEWAQGRMAIGLIRDTNTYEFYDTKVSKQVPFASISKDIDRFSNNGRELERFFNSVIADYRGSNAPSKERDSAPVFYSQMAKAIDELHHDKVGTNLFVNYLKGKGVKNEEIRWSGIVPFLQGRKSVSKAELQEFAKNSMLQLEEVTLSSADDVSDSLNDKLRELGIGSISAYDYVDEYEGEFSGETFMDDIETAWENGEITNDQKIAIENFYYKLTDKGIDNPRYSEYTTDGGSNYREILFKMPDSYYQSAHWQGHNGVLAHTRVQDFDTADGKMLFVEEIQSDWHNDGKKKGYQKATNEKLEIKHEAGTFRLYVNGEKTYHFEYDDSFAIEDDNYKVVGYDTDKAYESLKKTYEKNKTSVNPPEAPFKNTYTDFVMKRLLRMAAEGGYDSIGWTTGKMQEERWSDKYAEGYRIEYDQDIPKFMRKYGSQWGLKVEKTTIDAGDWYEEAQTPVWTVKLNDAVKKSVTEKGQPLYSFRGLNKDNIEVYETSADTLSLTWKERVKQFKDLIANDYVGKKARFVRNGHEYFAELDPTFGGKTVNGETNFTQRGKKAYINAGADGDLFNLIGNTKYDTSDPDTKNHKGKDGFTDYFDYFVKDVQIDNRVYSLNATVKKQYGTRDGFTYTLYLKENKSKKASPAVTMPNNGGFIGAGNASMNTVPQTGSSVKTSDRNPNSLDTRTLLSNALATTAQNDIEKKYIADYQSNIDKLNDAQNKLTELRAEIKEISFGSGKRDMEKLRSLQNEATKLANRITIYDKKLLNLESTKPLKSVLEREKASAVRRAEARSKEELKAYKEKALADQQRLVQKYKEKTNSRKETELRNKVKKYIEEFRQRLVNPTDRRYVPKALVNGIIEVYDAIDPTGADQTTQAAEKYRTAKMALAQLKMAYDSLQTEDYEFSSEFSSEFSQKISDLADTVGDKPLRDMNREELEDVYTILHDISAMLKDATKQIGVDEAITNYQAGQQIIADMDKVKSLGLTTNQIMTFFREWTENPMRAVREMSGFDKDARLVKLFEALNEGRRKADTFSMEMHKKFDRLRNTKEGEKAFNDAVEKASIEVFDTLGKSVKISKMQAMQAILTYERELANKNRNHLSSPVRFTDVALDIKGKYTDAFDNGYNVIVDEDFVKRAKASFTAWDMEYLNIARKFFNEDSKNAVNEVSMITKHRPIANELAYIPYYVNQDYIAKDSENVKFDASIEGMGMLKTVVNNARQQLVMRGLNSIVDDHIGKVSKLYGLAIPVRNWNKAFNMKQTDKDGGNSVKSVIRDVWNTGGVELLDQAVADMQSNRRSESAKALSTVKSVFVTSTLAGNVSVWMKQAASYPTAGAYLSPQSLLKALPNFVKKLDSLYDEIDANTSQHYIRRIGLSTQELGEMNQTHGWQNKINKRLGKFSPMNWIQAMDVKTTAVLWLACKNEIESRGISQSDESYWDAVTKLYDQVIEETQPMYDSLHRAEITKNAALKNIIMFQTQPIQNSGILREGAMEYRATKKEYGASSAEAKQALKKFSMAVGSQVASHLVFTAMTLLAASILHKMNPYRDDDDELTLESVSEEFFKQFMKNYFGAIIPVFGSYATSIMEKFVDGTRYDVLSDPTVDKINTTINNFSKLKNPSMESFITMANDIASYFGIPAQNLYNIYNGVKLHIEDAKNGQFWSFEAGVDSERTNSQDIDRAYKAYLEGDSAKVQEILEAMYNEQLEQGKAKDDAKTTIKSAITSKVKATYIVAYKTKDEAKMLEIRKFMAETKYYADVVATVQDWLKDYQKKDEKFKEDYLEAYKEGNTARMNYLRNQMINTKYYGNGDDVDAILKKWAK